MYLVKTPWIAKRLYTNYVWSGKPKANAVYLTFDDGPIPEATPWVLEQLEKVGAKATFFCIGANVEKHPDIFQMVQDHGHLIGNHTQTHPSGWASKHDAYIQNVKNASKVISSNLFRPPYGRIKDSQAKTLMEAGYKIIMWDILSGDFDSTISADKCYQNVMNHIESGSIVVLHDSLKSIAKLKAFLPDLLDTLQDEGFEMLSLDGLE